MKKTPTKKVAVEAKPTAAVNGVPTEASKPTPAKKAVATKRPAAKKRSASKRPVATKALAKKAAPAKRVIAKKAPAKKVVAKKAAPARATRKRVAKPAARTRAAKAPVARRAGSAAPKGRVTQTRPSGKKMSKVDAKSLVADSLASMKSVERTARKLLTEIHHREVEIAKLKGQIVDLNSSLKREKKANKRQGKAAEKVLLRAHASVKRHAARAKEAAAATPVANAPKVKFSTHLSRAAKKSPAAQPNMKKHAAKHAKHSKIAAMGKELVAKLN